MSVARFHSGVPRLQELAGPHGEGAGVLHLAEVEVLLGGASRAMPSSPFVS